MEVLKITYPQPIRALIGQGYVVKRLVINDNGLVTVWLSSGNIGRSRSHQELIPGLEIRLVRNGVGGIDYGHS